MIKKTIDKINITIEGIDDILDDELRQYIKYTNQTYIKDPKHQTLTDLKLYFNKDDVKIEYKASLTKFERIRRITGYLTGSLDSWNNSKQSEEKDRVKHDFEKEETIYRLDTYNRVIPITRNCLNQEIEYKIA